MSERKPSGLPVDVEAALETARLILEDEPGATINEAMDRPAAAAETVRELAAALLAQKRRDERTSEEVAKIAGRVQGMGRDRLAHYAKAQPWEVADWLVTLAGSALGQRRD